MSSRKLDLLCMGRVAVDLYAKEVGVSLEEAKSFAKYVGGCPGNIAIGTSRLGLKSGIISRVGNEAMGRFVRETLESEGVDVSTLKTDSERLTGLVLLGIDPPDHFPLIFYRENCADMAISKEDFSRETFLESEALLVTGTHCSQEMAYQTTLQAVALAKSVGTKVILDIDYRPVLWKATGHGGGEERYVVCKEVSDRLGRLIPSCDLIVGTEEEILVAANKSEVDEAVAYLKEKSDALIVRKRGEKGCVVYGRGGDASVIEGMPFPTEVLNLLGAGDAFLSGFLRGYLRGHSLEECCQFGNGSGSIVVGRHGCSPAMPYWEELQEYISVPC